MNPQQTVPVEGGERSVMAAPPFSGIGPRAMAGDERAKKASAGTTIHWTSGEAPIRADPMRNRYLPAEVLQRRRDLSRRAAVGRAVAEAFCWHRRGRSVAVFTTAGPTSPSLLVSALTANAGPAQQTKFEASNGGQSLFRHRGSNERTSRSPTPARGFASETTVPVLRSVDARLHGVSYGDLLVAHARDMKPNTAAREKAPTKKCNPSLAF